MGSRKGSQLFDLEDRTFQFAKRVRVLIKMISMTLWNREDARQLLRASGSVGTNYIAANNALGKKDFLMRIRICRKEARESGYWLNLIDLSSTGTLGQERQLLFEESQELMKIFGAILRNRTIKKS
ncbi:MAG: four helix bundle protein [Acidobacteriota bacterium]|nr:four helix bundle protein [Acidobacteriota bacterium]